MSEFENFSQVAVISMPQAPAPRRRIRISSVGLAVAIVGSALIGHAAQAQVTTNLLTNAGAETGDLTGWTVGGTSNPTVDNGAFDGGINPHTGNFDFVGGNGLSGTLTQTVSLVGNQGITAAQIDAGTLPVNITFWEQGLDQGDPSDNAQVSLTFFNAGNTAIGTNSSDVLDNHSNAWGSYTGSFFIPAGTRTISYTMNFLRNQGSDNDSFVDDNSLTVGKIGGAASAPEPGSLALAFLGSTGIIGAVLRRKKA